MRNLLHDLNALWRQVKLTTISKLKNNPILPELASAVLLTLDIANDANCFVVAANTRLTKPSA